MPNDSPAADGGLGGPRIDPGDDADVDQWATTFDVRAEQVRDAVRAVGDRAGDVEMHLKGSRSTTNSERTAENG